MGLVSEAKDIVDELKGEMEDWQGTLPENLQNGSKAEEIQTAIDELDEVYDKLEECDCEVNFPGMMG